MHTSNFTVLPFFDISIIYAKYLAHNLGSATEMIRISLWLMITCQSNYYLTIETRYTKIRYIGKMFSKACLQALVSVIMNIEEIKNE